MKRKILKTKELTKSLARVPIFKFLIVQFLQLMESYIVNDKEEVKNATNIPTCTQNIVSSSLLLRVLLLALPTKVLNIGRGQAVKKHNKTKKWNVIRFTFLNEASIVLFAFLQFLFWLAGFYKILSPQEARGPNIFILVFSANLNLSYIKWTFFSAVTIAKTIILIVVKIVQFVLSSPTDSSRPTIFGIFCTQTNDFGMGLPILDAVYNTSHQYVGPF